ncbi:nicotinamidase-like [Pecten maximus]|uniref:nicotinamidase-like n=1 Tax=Pecten maximus TaxID=6579 RepID=UPI0014582A5D|nr:nicotinamidase-like [Pecten maximus]
MLSADRDNFLEKYVDRKVDFDKRSCSECFHHYDLDRDSALSQSEFEGLLSDLFCDGGQPYPITSQVLSQFMELLDIDKDGKISKKEFMENSFYWLKQILQPVAALVIVDVQNDFLDGSLSLRNCPAGQDGNGVIPAINSVLDTVTFDLVVYTRDWHPEDHISFIENVDKRPLQTNSHKSQVPPKVLDTVVFEGPPVTEQKLWPSHCVQGSWGAEIHPDLKFVEGGVIVNKGMRSDVDSYSAFWDNNKLAETDLVRILSKHKVTDVYLCGVAYDVCVGSTGVHALEHGYRTILIEDAARGVNLDDISNMRKNLQEKGAVITNSSKVKDLVESVDRQVALGYQTAKNVALARRMVKEGMVKTKE